MVRFIGILWNGDSGGSSRWTNVNVKTESVDVSAGYLWWEGCGPASTDVNRASHYWFSSRLFTHNTANAAYAVHCSENWFFGSEIASEGTAILAAANANAATAKPEVHVYGSVIRVKPRPGFTTAPPAGVGDSFNGVIAVAAGRNADVHVHGTGIDVIGNELPNSIAALVAWDGGAIHANEAAFNLKPGIGKVTRIIKDTNPNTHVHAPYLWPEHATPPNITSVLGADMAVVTSTSDSRPHLVIYDSNCPSKWYDTADKLCRP